MLVSVQVSYPQTFQFEVDPTMDIEAIREAIKEQADYYMESSPPEPIITGCLPMDDADAYCELINRIVE